MLLWDFIFLFFYFFNQIIVLEGLRPYGTQYMQTGGRARGAGYVTLV
jgi:hypothetical protein